MEIAIVKDIEKKYLEAVEYYEYDIKNSQQASLDSYINLAFLYWEFATEQISFNDPNNISDEFSTIGGKRYSLIIEMGLEQYPNSIELKFWQRYFSYRLVNREFPYEECEKMISDHKGEKSLVPYFYLYIFDKKKHKQKKEKLLELCISKPTAKFNYIKSFLV